MSDASLQARAPVDASEQSIHLNIYSNGSSNTYIKQATSTLQTVNQNPVVFTPRTVITNVDGFAVTSVGIPYTFVTVSEDIDLDISFVQTRIAAVNANNGEYPLPIYEAIERQLVLEKAKHYYVDVTSNGDTSNWRSEWGPGLGANQFAGNYVYRRWDATTENTQLNFYSPLGDLHGTLGDPFNFKLPSGVYTIASVIEAFSQQWAIYRAQKATECLAVKNAIGSNDNLKASYDHLATFWGKAVLELVQTADQRLALATSVIDAEATRPDTVPSSSMRSFVVMVANNSPFNVTSNTPGVGSSGTLTINGTDVRRGQIYIADKTMVGQTIRHSITNATLTVTAVENVTNGRLPVRLHSESMKASDGLVQVTWTSTHDTYTVGLQPSGNTFELTVDDFGLYGGSTIWDIAEIDSLAWTIPMIVQHGGTDLLGLGFTGRNEAVQVGTLFERSTLGNPQTFSGGDISSKLSPNVLTSTYTATNSLNQSSIKYNLSDNLTTTWPHVITEAAAYDTRVSLRISATTYTGRIVHGGAISSTSVPSITFIVEWDATGPATGGIFVSDAVISVIIIHAPVNGLLGQFYTAPYQLTAFSQNAAFLSDYRAHVHYHNLLGATSTSSVAKTGKVGWVTFSDTAGVVGVKSDRLYLQFNTSHGISETRRIFIDSFALASDVRLYQSDFLLTIDSIPVGTDVAPYDLIRQENNAGDNIRTFQNPRQIDQIDLTLMGEFTRVNDSGERIVEFRQLNMNGYPWWVELVLYRKSVQIYPWIIPKPLQMGGRPAQRFIKSVANGKAEIVMQDLEPYMNSTQLNATYPLNGSPYGWAS